MKYLKYIFIILIIAGYLNSVRAQLPVVIYKGGNGAGWHAGYYKMPSVNIFKGGNGDGWDTDSFAQPVQNIFTGGDGDGWDNITFVPAIENNFFKGGIGDGWSSDLFTRALMNIFNGGIGDGWSSEEYAQTLINIFNGGIGDGWDADEYVSGLTNIFNGGIGDGWASVLRPMGPLPLELISFDAIQKDQGVFLNWTSATEQNTSHFEIERSNGNNDFISIGRVSAAGNSSTDKSYDFLDQEPMQGNNLYRLKMVDIDGSYTYSNVVLVKIDGDGMKIIAFPNPVRDVVNLKLSKTYDHKIPCQIYDAGGKLVFTGTIPKGNNLQQFNIGHLSQGTYIIRLILPDGEQRAIKIVK